MSKLKNRMAGKKLDERFGEGFTDRVKGDGMQEPTKQGYSRRELLAEFRERPDGVKIDEGDGNLVDKYQGLVDSGSRFNRKAQDYLEGHGVVFNRPEDIDESEDIDFVTDEPMEQLPVEYAPDVPTFSSAPIQSIVSSGEGGMNINQDNDISNLIYGNDNNVSNYQNNSIGDSMNIGDGLYAKRDPMGFKNKFMQNLFN